MPESRDQFRSHLQKVLVHAEKQACELKIKRKDGTSFPASLVSVAARDSAGKYSQCRSILTDVTARMQLEEILRRRSSMPEFNPNPIVDVDWTGNVAYMNPAAERLFPDLGTASLKHPWLTDWPSLLHTLENRKEESLLREVQVGDSWYEQSIFFSKENKRLLIHGYEITERKQAEAALKASETRYRRLFETAQDGILILDAETGRIADVNPFLIEMLGYSSEDFWGKQLWEIGPFKNTEAAKNRLWGIAEQRICPLQGFTPGNERRTAHCRGICQ